MHPAAKKEPATYFKLAWEGSFIWAARAFLRKLHHFKVGDKLAGYSQSQMDFGTTLG